MKRRIKINYIQWDRQDAIEKVTKRTLQLLNKKIIFNVISLNLRHNKFFYDLILLFKNLSSLITLSKKEIIHFEEPKKIEPLINTFLHFDKSILTVHHLEKTNKFGVLFIEEKFKHRSFTKLIAISRKTKQDLIEQYGIDPAKITVVYNGVDHKIFKPISKRVKSLKNKRYILYLGSEVPRKNIENLLKAFKEISKKYPDLFLVKAGYSGGNQYREKTLNLIKELGLEEKIIIISERLEEKDLPLYYSNAELFVYPTLQEGFGMPLVEAMACGCPVVTSNIAPMDEIVKNQVLIDPYNFKDIAKGMDKILSNKKYKKELKKKAITRAKDFDWEKSAKKILKVYEELDKI